MPLKGDCKDFQCSVVSVDDSVFSYVSSILRTFAQHKDDRRRVEKAFIESTGLPSGKVSRSEFRITNLYLLDLLLNTGRVNFAVTVQFR